MISSEEDARLVLKKWRDESRLLLIAIGVIGATGATLPGVITDISEDSLQLNGPDGDTEVSVVLAGSRFEFVPVAEVPLLQHLDASTLPVTEALTIRGRGSSVCFLIVLPDRNGS